ncbi:unnamed protein product [Ranitomeya imitator]|uniref:GTP-binding protein 10 n=1 Tax=Ranitomeya imitator TaxID=111125 RepID=A0ABN9MCG3_9NEOB|nr:unnamed protein product [Ranitomeya imitator]
MTPSLRILAGSDNPGESGTKLLDRASAFTFLEPGRAAGPRKDAVAQIQHWNIDKEQGRQTQVELNSKAANELTKTPEGGSPETAIPLVTTEVNSATEFTTGLVSPALMVTFGVKKILSILLFFCFSVFHVVVSRVVVSSVVISAVVVSAVVVSAVVVVVIGVVFRVVVVIGSPFLYGNFIDNLRILVKGGAGGMGLPRLGGEGGKGGDVWVVAKDGVTMKHIKSKFPQKRFVGGVGVNSSVRSLKGTSGADCEVEVPVGIAITTDTGTKIGDLDRDGDKLRVARGGLGGGYRTEFLPAKGQKKVILTTVQPELGKIMYPDFKQISVADLPGLIEGAHRNRGMGHKFLKHVERTKQLLFVVDVSGFQLSVKSPFRTAFETVQLLTLELELYKEDLLDKPALLAVNKMDLPEADDKLRELVKQLENPQDYLHTLPEELVPDCQINFKEIIPISVATNQGISDLTRCIRRSIDEHAELEIQETAKEKLRSLHITSSQSVRQLLPPEQTLD